MEPMSESESEEVLDPEIEAAAAAALDNLLPQKSKLAYEKAYSKFEAWCIEKHVKKIEEKVLLAYFSTVMSDKKPSSTWTHYSMLKSTLNTKKKSTSAIFYSCLHF